MATFAPTALQRRKKQTVYGKAARQAYSINHDFLEDDEPVAGPPAKRAKPTNAIVSRPVQLSTMRLDPAVDTSAKPASPLRRKGALPQVVRSPVKTADAFDVPSSEDEGTHAIEYASTPLKLHSKSELVKEPVETTRLAPWERKGARATRIASGNSTGTDSGPEKQLMRELGGDSAPQVAKANPAGTTMGAGRATPRSEDRNANSDKGEVLTTGSALDRLAARRPTAKFNARAIGGDLSGSAIASVKRSTPELDDQQLPAIKKPRKVTASKPTTSHVGSLDMQIRYHPRSKQSEGNSSAGQADIFDVPMESNETLPLKPVMRISPKPESRQMSRPPARASRLSSPKTSVSAPDRLTEMLPPDEDAYSLADVSPEETMSQKTIPRATLRATSTRSSSTPRSGRSTTPQTTGALTPKQSQMWADFFDPANSSDPPTPVTKLKKLGIAEKKITAESEVKSTKVVTKAKAGASRRRTRAVDRLKALAVSSSEEDSSEDEKDDMIDAEFSMAAPASQSVTRQDAQNRISQNTQTSQSQEKPHASTEGGPRITYAKARSHLAEESLDNMILDLPIDTPQRPTATARRVGKPAAVMKKSAFDMEDSDDDAPTKGVRNIHDLRAAGRNTRVMGEIGDLLQEIADHSTTARSRRRSALLELATKLLDKAFAEQFLGLSFEHQLIAESSAPPDPVADFILATSYTLLLSAELSAHTTRSFATVLPWLAMSFPDTMDIAKRAKEQRSNMSKAAQSDVAAFAQKIQSSTLLWNDSTPLTLSSRLVSLKATDILVGKLRGLGDKSELLEPDGLGPLVPNEGLFVAIDRNPDLAWQSSMVVSILEALSTLSAVDKWPKPVLQAVASLPAAFAQIWKTVPHTKWLAYRLCLNLTNDPAINQNLFTDNFAVRYLLSDIVSGFEKLHRSAPVTDEPDAQESNALHLDLLVLAIGILTNLAEHNDTARSQATTDPSSFPALRSIIGTFRAGQERLLEAASEQESATNVAFGYLAVMLANICQDAEARDVVKGLLPGGKLDVLVEAVEEFVRHHRKVDEVGFEGAEGKEVWGRFTERLVSVLERLKRDVGDEGPQ